MNALTGFNTVTGDSTANYGYQGVVMMLTMKMARHWERYPNGDFQLQFLVRF